jgi:hypothetical protein
MPLNLPLRISILLAPFFLAACAPVEFDAAPVGGQITRVGNSQDVAFQADPLIYRMRADEGHLVFWIDNPTNQTVEFLGDKSNVVDPEGIAHPLRGQTIEPLGSIKEIFPPMMDDSQAPPSNAAQPINPYDQPGFITVPNAQFESGPDQPWQWDDELYIQVNLYFNREGHPFEQHFSIRRVRK